MTRVPQRLCAGLLALLMLVTGCHDWVAIPTHDLARLPPASAERKFLTQDGQYLESPYDLRVTDERGQTRSFERPAVGEVAPGQVRVIDQEHDTRYDVARVREVQVRQFNRSNVLALTLPAVLLLAGLVVVGVKQWPRATSGTALDD